MIITAILVLVLIPSMSGAGEIVLYFEDKENYPEELGNTSEVNISYPGVAVEFFKSVCESLTLEVRFKRAPWKRCLETELKSGAADGVFECGYQKEREEYGVFPMKNGVPDNGRRYSSREYHFYRLKGSDFSWDGKKTGGRRGKIGVPQGYSIVSDLVKMNQDVEVSPDTLTAMKKLLTGRICAVAALEGEGDHLLRKNAKFGDAIEKVEIPIVVRYYFLILSHQFVARDPVLAEKIWDRVGEMRDVLIPELLKKYGY